MKNLKVWVLKAAQSVHLSEAKAHYYSSQAQA